MTGKKSAFYLSTDGILLIMLFRLNNSETMDIIFPESDMRVSE